VLRMMPSAGAWRLARNGYLSEEGVEGEFSEVGSGSSTS
jgi:hypothetical protein